MDDYRHFRLVIVGDDPEKLLDRYDKRKHIGRVVKYRFKDAEKIFKNHLSVLKGILDKTEEGTPYHSIVSGQYEVDKTMDCVDYYYEITENMQIDEASGDAYVLENPEGRYDSAKIGGDFALPLITKDGNEVYQARKGDVDWEKIHLSGSEAYEIAWDTVMGGKKAENENEKYIYENMKNRTYYFEQYGTRENYIKSSTAFWGYAFLSEETGWVEIEDDKNQYEWVTEYYDKFIKPLDDNKLISIYECIRQKEN